MYIPVHNSCFHITDKNAWYPALRNIRNNTFTQHST